MLHLLNPMANFCGGSEQRTLSLFRVLAEFGPVELWALAPDRAFYGLAPMRMPDPMRGVVPRGGTLAVIGSYFELPNWVERGRFERILVTYNIPNLQHLDHLLKTIQGRGLDRVEFIAASPALAKQLEKRGVGVAAVEPSWIDIEAFRPSGSRKSGAFTVGRMSRDVPEKFHAEDAALFLQLADAGCQVKLMGATCLSLPSHAQIEILPEGAQPAAEFLRDLDAFAYRTSEGWYEAFGRVVVEAMASGVVPVAHEQGGYAEIIQSGTNGFLFSGSKEAAKLVLQLRNEFQLRERMAGAARQTAEFLYGEDRRRALAEFYLGSSR